MNGYEDWAEARGLDPDDNATIEEYDDARREAHDADAYDRAGNR